MAYNFSKGSGKNKRFNYLKGANGDKLRPLSPLSPASNRSAIARYLSSTTTGNDSPTRLLDTLNSGTRRTGESGRCLVINGTNQVGRIPDNTALDITDNLTVMCWAKNDSSNINQQFLFSKFDNTANKREWAFYIDSNEKTSIALGDPIDGGLETIIEDDNNVVVNQWHHYAFTFKAGVITLYIDGLERSYNTTQPIPLSLYNSDIDLTIGCFLSGNTPSNLWDGQIFDARIYAGDSTVLTDEQIAAIYADPTSNIQFAGQDLRAHYKLDDAGTATIRDSSGNNNHGTVENSIIPTIHGTQDLWSFQNQLGFNKRMNFDGVDDYISAPAISYLADEDFSFEAYVLFNNFTSTPCVMQVGDNVDDRLALFITSSGEISLYTKNGSSVTVNSGYSISTGVLYKIKWTLDRDGLVRFYVDESEVGTAGNISSVSSVTATALQIGKVTHTSSNYVDGIIYDAAFYNSSGTLTNKFVGKGNTDTDWRDTVGSLNPTVNGSPYNIYLPRDESDPSNDVLGSPLTYTGRRPNDGALINSNCLTADGTLYIAAVHLTGSETVVSSEGTSTPSISAGRIDFTAGTCWNLLLSDGTHYKLAHGYGTIIADSGGDENHGTLTNATLANAWGATQNDYHSNLLDGCGKRMWFDDNFYVQTPVSALDFGSSYFAIEADILLSEITNPGGNDIISLYDGVFNQRFWIFKVEDNGKLKLVTNDTGQGADNVVAESTQVLSIRTHYSVKVIKTGTSVNFYVNDIDAGSGSAVNTILSPTILTKSAIGVNLVESGSVFRQFKGVINNVKVTKNSELTLDIIGNGNTNADWIDTTENGNNGTVVGSPEPYYIPAAQNGLDAFGQPLTDPFVDGKRNRAETEYAYNPDSTPEMSNIYTESVFNGSSSNGYVSNDSVMNFTDNLTVTCWAKSDLTDISSSADTLVSMFEDSGDLEVWRMEISTDEKLRFQIGNAGGTGATIETADSAHPIDNWTHYAATFDGGVVKLYINGELQGSSESSAHASTLNGRSAPLVLGAYFWSGGGGSFQEWDGSLRNVRVYKGDSRPMNSAEINKDLYETDYQPRFEGQTVIASYDLVKDTIDRSGNGLHAANTGITFTKKTVPSAMGFGDDLGEDGIVTKTVKFNDNGWGAVFDGSSEIVVGNREKLKIDANPFEIECALKTSDAGDNTILSKYQTSGNLRSYSLNVESGKVVFHSSSNGTAVTSATGSIDVDDGSWHRIKVQKESESGTSLKMFIDGTEDGSVAGSVAANLSSNISNVAIGAYNTDATSANVFTGTLRDLSVKKNGVEVAHWELAKDTRDSTPNEYHGTNDGVTFLAPDEESSITILDRYPLGKTSQFLKQYNKSRLYENY